jgi:hypothetical protein
MNRIIRTLPYFFYAQEGLSRPASTFKETMRPDCEMKEVR